MRRCPACDQWLPLHYFAITRNRYNLRCRPCEADVARVRKHGMRLDEKEFIAEHQDGCAICGRLEPGQKGWVIDHDHACCPSDKSCQDCRRGVLCQWCNNALGYAFDNPAILRRAADYLALGTRLIPADWGQSTEPVKRAGRVAPTDETDGLTEKVAEVEGSLTAVDAGRASNGSIR